jgi:hypothetical protein
MVLNKGQSLIKNLLVDFIVAELNLEATTNLISYFHCAFLLIKTKTQKGVFL